MIQGSDDFFLKIPEPQRSTLLYLRHFFVNEIGLEEHMKFNTPFYNFKKKWFCYISYSEKRKNEIYIGFVKGYKIEFQGLESEGRKQIKIYRIDPEKDIDVMALKKITTTLKSHYD
ncbi:MAG: DUF1801 domain-containing protein [Burkholderiales bacterium]|nr:DUF1801 domain-containing protein [Bacteroidia bacterium]